MKIAYTPTQEDYLDTQRAHAWRRYSPTMAKLQKILSPICGLLLLWCSFYIYKNRGNSLIILAGVLAGLYVLLSTSVLAPILYRRSFRRTRGIGGENIIEITEEDIRVDCPGRSNGTMQWSAVRGYYDAPKVTLLYVTTSTFMYIPRRLLDEAQHTELIQLLSRKNIPIGAPKPAPK